MKVAPSVVETKPWRQILVADDGREKRDQALLGSRGTTGHQQAMGPGVRVGRYRRSWHEGTGASLAHFPCSGVRTREPFGPDQQGHTGQSAEAEIRQAHRVAASTGLPSAQT
jgi:hypothetical protein